MTNKTKTAPTDIHRVVSANTQALNHAIVQFVATAGACYFDQLFANFSNTADPLAVGAFRKRLDYLVYAGRLGTSGVRGRRTYVPAAPAHPQVTPRAKPTQVASAPAGSAPAGGLVPPRTFDCLHGPQYRPDAGPAMRPGALDFKRCPSRGYLC